MSPAPEHPRSLADDVLADSAMDQALTWLVELDEANPEQLARFHAWLHADLANSQAFARAQAVWNSQPVRHTAELFAQPVDRPAPASLPPEPDHQHP